MTFGRGSLLLSIAVKHLAGRKRATLVAVSGVAVGVGFFLAVSALMVGSQADFVDRLINAAPHIIVTDEIRSPPPQAARIAFPDAALNVRHFKRRTEQRGIRGWPAIVASLGATPGSIASPTLSGGITLTLGGHGEALGIVGVDPSIETQVSTIEKKSAFRAPARSRNDAGRRDHRGRNGGASRCRHG